MILYTYGCSWTEGEGVDITIENTLLNKAEKNLFRNKFAWPALLSEKLNCNHINNGISGNNNNNIFNKIVEDVQLNKILKDDLVIIMWSSSLRDNVPFLPNNEWVSWSVKHLMETPNKFKDSYKSDNKTYNSFLSSYKDFFLLNVFNQNYYNIVNQNYIIFLQKLFEFYEIKYLMCDAFEPMVIDLDKKDDITNIINKSTYWEFNKKTIRDLLNDTNRLDIWEHQDTTFKTRATQHPNKDGYKLISQELYNYIVKNNII